MRWIKSTIHEVQKCKPANLEPSSQIISHNSSQDEHLGGFEKYGYSTIKAFYASLWYIAPFLHASCAINTEDLSIDPFTILASKETNNPRNINWQTNTVQRTPCRSILRK
jgi:hypothetical protein